LKRAFQRVLQRTLGLPRYLDLFARYRLRASGWDRSDAAFRHFVNRLPTDGLVIDAGANVGVTTAWLARHVTGGTVHAFEPNPLSRETARRLLGRLGLGNVVLHEEALGRAEGTVDLLMPVEGNVRLHGLSRVTAEAARRPSGDAFEVPCRTLDGIAEWFAPGARVTGLKLDVEDFESEVIEGARELLRRHRPFVYCELWLTPNRDRVVALMRELGYEAFVYDGTALVAFEPWPHASTQDFFFVPEVPAASA
jgi:FkbM family methyltransferase